MHKVKVIVGNCGLNVHNFGVCCDLLSNCAKVLQGCFKCAKSCGKVNFKCVKECNLFTILGFACGIQYLSDIDQNKKRQSVRLPLF